MKRLLCLFPVLVILLLSSASSARIHPDYIVKFYYQSTGESYFSPTGVMSPEAHILHWGEQSIEGLMTCYLRGHTSPGLQDPFPEGMQLLKVEDTNGSLTLVFDERLASLHSIKLRVAANCIAQTINSFGGYQSITLYAQARDGTPLELDKQPCLRIYPSKLVLEDYSTGKEGIQVRLYFMDADGRYLVPDTRSVSRKEGKALLTEVLDDLIEGPVSAECRATIPDDTMPIRLYFKGQGEQGSGDTSRICVVDFSSEFMERLSDDALRARLTLFSVVNSLTQFDHVDAVEIQVNSEAISTDIWPDAAHELVFDSRMIESAGENTYDATLYVCLDGSDTPVPFPARIPRLAGDNLVKTVIHALTTFEAGNGYYSPLEGQPEPSYGEENGVVWVQLPEKLLQQCEGAAERKLLRQCISETILDLPHVTAVYFKADS